MITGDGTVTRIWFLEKFRCRKLQVQGGGRLGLTVKGRLDWNLILWGGGGFQECKVSKELALMGSQPYAGKH